MKIQIEISDVALRKVSALLMLAAQENEVEQVKSTIKRLKESTEPFPLDTSLLEEEKESIEVGLLSVLASQIIKEKERP